MIEVVITGDRAMMRTLQAVARRTPARVAAALFQEAEIGMGTKKRRTPVKTGVLRSSGRVDPPHLSSSTISVRLSFGGAASGYAIPVHENLSARHPVGQAKYAESVLMESRATMLARLARRIDIA